MHADVFFEKWANPVLFFIYFWSFQTNKQTIHFFTTNKRKNVKSIQYMAPGFEPMTSRECVTIVNYDSRVIPIRKLPGNNYTAVSKTKLCLE